ncbi:hypothetical protein N7539_000619 [Penicillium diatomitis]|uniref:Uncharacterized protein n=1 Tax=Penicillium diatomitis TaxID=2819901 RepID=A0A9X0C2C4_9EURO|nr:uncharacterized protein N7539_000619 [Penicillium diatomitis]KAJ5495503.1 hypothetical protein N7539_000619 [Penicillium diatomitis]
MLMNHHRREELIRFVRKIDALLIREDVDDFLTFAETTESYPTGAFMRLIDNNPSLDKGPHSSFGDLVSNESFSKLLIPGCRVGWAEANESSFYGLSHAQVN